MIISSIVAVSKNNVIGVDNDLPWHLPADLKHFKEKTMGHYILMGRKSFDSIGKPLPGRTNIVLTRNSDFYHSAIKTVPSIPDGLLYAQNAGVKELFVIGGSNIYEQTKSLWNRLFLTKVDVEIPNGSAFFPKIELDQWQLLSEEKHKADEKNAFNYSFCEYVR